MMKKIAIAFLALCLLALSLLLLVPSTWVVSEVAKKFPKVDYHSADSFWWNGRVNNVSLILRGYRLFIGDVEWQYNALPLLSKKVCASFTSVDETLQTEGQLCYHLDDGTVVLHQLGVRILAEEVAVISGVEVAGHFDGYFQNITLRDQVLVNVDGDIAWKKAQWHNGEKWVELGELLFSAITNGNKVIVQSTDVDGPIVIDVKTVVSQNNLRSIEGYVEVTTTTDPSLLDTLDFLTEEKRGRRYIVNKRF